MTNFTKIMEIIEIPDPSCTQYIIESGGDVDAALKRHGDHILRNVANHLPKTFSYTLIMWLRPETLPDPQSRLKIYMIPKADNRDDVDSLFLLIQFGPLSKYYKFKSIDELSLPWGKMHAGSVISRKVNFTAPLIIPELNYNIPDAYLSFKEFERSPFQDFSFLDRVLHPVPKEVIIVCSVSPVNVPVLCSDSSKYLNALQLIKYSKRSGQTSTSIPNYLSDDKPRYLSSQAGTIQAEPDPMVDDIFRCQQKLHESLLDPLLFFSVTVFSESASYSNLISSVVAENSIKDGHYEITHLTNEDLLLEALECAKQYRPFTLPKVNKETTGRYRSIFNNLESIKQIGNVEDVGGFFHPLVGSWRSPYTIRQNTDPVKIESENSFIVGHDLECANKPIRWIFEFLCKHVLVCGSTGKGKTTFIFYLLFVLFEQSIPWIVIETSKTHYRGLKTLQKKALKFAEAIQIYTVGDNRNSPLRINPLARPADLTVDEHIEKVMQSILAAIAAPGSLRAILHEAMVELYRDYSDIDNPPLMYQLVDAIDKVMNRKGYSEATKADILTALCTRMQAFLLGTCGEMFKCVKSYPSIKSLVSGYSIIELDRLVKDSKCLTTLFLLKEICEYFKYAPPVKKHPRLVLFIEEGHNVVANLENVQLTDEEADVQARTAELIVEMMAELRAVGVAIVIVDQNVSSVAESVLKNATSTVFFNQNQSQDRELISKTILLPDFYQEELGRLDPGEAYISTEGYYRARKIRTVNFQAEYPIDEYKAKTDLMSLMHNQQWFQDVHSERILEELRLLQDAMNEFDRKKIAIIQEFTQLQAEFVKTEKVSEKILAKSINGTISLKNNLAEVSELFERTDYTRYYGKMPCCEFENVPDIADLNRSLSDRYDKNVADYTEVITAMDTFINRCNNLLRSLRG